MVAFRSILPFLVILCKCSCTAWLTPFQYNKLHSVRPNRYVGTRIFYFGERSWTDVRKSQRLSRPDKNDSLQEKNWIRHLNLFFRKRGISPWVHVICLLVITACVPGVALASTASTAATPAVPTAAAPLAASSSSVTSTVAVGALGSSQSLSKAMELRLSFRLLFASLVGGAVGWERSATHHSAGVRTMALVSLGAAAFTICSMFGFLACQKFDPSRMASNVASGVGFIGAGVITTHKMRADPGQSNPNSVVHGLTTAAAIWLSAAVGVASGVGLYFIAGTTALITIGVLRFGRVKHTPLGKRIGYTSKKSSQLYSTETHDLRNWDEGNVQQPPVPVTFRDKGKSYKRVDEDVKGHDVDGIFKSRGNQNFAREAVSSAELLPEKIIVSIKEQTKETNSNDNNLDMHTKENVGKVSP